MSERESRHTWQKDVIRQVLESEDDFLSAQRLHSLLAQSGEKIGLATVYRHLSAMHESGAVDCIQHHGVNLYRLCSAQRHHHHHLVCESCGKTVEIEPPDDKWLHSVAASQGFTVSSHTLEVYGLCPDCQKLS
ncbi:Fur family transcriptional regulator [Bifidobacterium favimelis]|uniref:Transcriptional repressor n=1 Tax=Bifidobacterium favimelis TaxID=3122979 RepID=A0ABU8ZNP2_9BIFI